MHMKIKIQCNFKLTELNNQFDFFMYNKYEIISSICIHEKCIEAILNPIRESITTMT